MTCWYRIGVLMMLLASIVDVCASDAGMPMQRNLHAVFVDRLEWQGAGQSTLEVNAWYGNELDKFVYGVELDSQADDQEWVLEAGGELALTAFWNARLQTRADLADEQEDYWLGIGVSGLAPYFIHTEVLLYAKNDSTLLNVEAEHEWLLSRRWLMVTRVEGQWRAGDTPSRGLQELEFGVRARYETVSRFSAYAGIEYQLDGVGENDRLAVVGGVSYWF